MAARFSLLRGYLVSQRGKKHAHGRLRQQSRTSTAKDMQQPLCKGQPCSSALPAPTAAPPWPGQPLAFLICHGSGPCQGTAATQEREEGCSIHTHLSMHGAAAGGANRGLQSSSILFNASTAAVQLYAIHCGPVIHPSVGLLAVQVPPSPGQHHFYLGC